MSETLKIIRDQFLPSVKQYGAERLVIPPKSWQEVKPGGASWIRLKEDVVIRPRKRRGPRVPFRGSRIYGNRSSEIASWPRDSLVEWKVPAMVLVTYGTADLYMEDYVLRCPAGYVIWLRPGGAHMACGQPHSIESSNQRSSIQPSPTRTNALLWFAPQMMANSMMGIWQCFTVDGRHCYTDHESMRYEDYILGNSRLVSYFTSLHEELEEHAKGFQDIYQGLMMAFLRAIVREMENDAFVRYQYPLDANAPGIKSSEPIDKAREYIASHLSQKLTIDQTARAVYMSRSQFVRCFARETGKTFNEYLTHQRVERAMYLLVETDWTVSHVSSYVGIQPDRLRVLFRERLGTSPQQYREQRRIAGSED